MDHNFKPKPDLLYLGFPKNQSYYYQLSPDSLIRYSLEHKEGILTNMGALAVDTGEFKGRSPKDRFIVKDVLTETQVWWSETNIPFASSSFDRLYKKVIKFLSDKTLFVRDAKARIGEQSHLSLRIITETAYQNLFANNLFIKPDTWNQIQQEWTVIASPGFKADPTEDQTRQQNFSIINFSKKIVLIGGTGYTGEIKKAIFSVLNFLLPAQGILPMHCAANIGRYGGTALFFGLSGTGKTTLSADKERRLIGDDEHGWGEHSIFNFEGGCYAKTVNLSPEGEPQIYAAIRYGALLENVCFYPNSESVDFQNISKTENTRVSYPLNFIENSVIPSVGNIPRHIFFLTADAFGVLPPIARLNAEQALYYFISGYTSKVAGTEHGINEPQATFSACFGKAFLPLHPAKYANLLKKKLMESKVNVWLINTGWTGGAYGKGTRMPLKHTRAMIKAAMSDELNDVEYECLPVFNLMIPKSCTNVPPELLNPVNTWTNESEYWLKANRLAQLFKENYTQFSHRPANSYELLKF